jgi:hypothetical protein
VSVRAGAAAAAGVTPHAAGAVKRERPRSELTPRSWTVKI